VWLTLLYRFWYVIPILALTASTAFYRHQAHQERDSRIQIQAAYDVFKAGVEQLGEAQIKRNKELAANQEKVNRETVKSADARVNSILDRYRLLASKSGSSGGILPPSAAAPAPVDDTARNDELLRLLRQADLQTGQLIELQEWVRKTR